MRLRIAGGPHDGQWRDVDVDRDCIELVKFEPVPMPYPPDASAIAGTVEKTVYTVRRLRYRHPDNSLEYLCFLAPVSMTDLDAIKHQFSK